MHSLYLLVAVGTLVSAAPKPSCAADLCFAAASFPATYAPIASAFCQSYVRKTLGTVTKTTTVTATVTSSRSLVTPTVTVNPNPITTTPVTTVTVTSKADYTSVLSSGLCTTIKSTSLGRQIYYTSRDGANEKVKRGVTSFPPPMTTGCSGNIPSLISSACSCFLTSKTVTKTDTKTVTATAKSTSVAPVTVTATRSVRTAATSVVTVTVSTTSTVAQSTCSSTTTVTDYGTDFTCGIPSPTTTASGSITCSNVAPTQTNARFRIEGASEGTIFEDCIISEPGDLTTPSGGTHLCDGTNNGASSTPGSTESTSLDSAADRDGFGFDGTYSSQFQDFFITSISATTQTASQFWGLLLDEAFTAVGGCGTKLPNGRRGLWAFDAFNKAAFLTLSPDYIVVKAGTTASVTVTVEATDGGSSNRSPFAGATIQQGTTSDANGKSTIAVPTEPGCYQYKATNPNAISSNAFYLTVLPA